MTGSASGVEPDVEQLRAVQAATPAAPLWVGSGLNRENAIDLLRHADSAIIGSALQRGGEAGAGVEMERVQQLVRVVRAGLGSE